MRLIAAAVVFLFSLPVLAASPATQPVTANKVEGPVTGALPDTISLTLNPYLSAEPGLAGASPLQVRFCSSKKIQQTLTVNGKSVQQSRLECYRPDRKLRLAGRRQLTGITVTPAIEGEWRWTDDYSLTFEPKKPWPAGEKYHVEFARDVFPSQVVLTGGTYNFATQPLTPEIASMAFFQDPNDVEKRGVSATITFNTPVAADMLKKHFDLSIIEYEDDAKKPEGKARTVAEHVSYDMVMNDEGTEATVTAPITVIPDKQRYMRAVIAPGLTAVSGGAALAAKGAGRLKEEAGIPSRYSYARITQVETRIVKNDRYEPEQMLIITSNVPMTSEDLRKHLKIFELPKDKAASTPGFPPKQDYAWTSSAEVDDALLKASEELKFTVQPTAEDYDTVHGIKFEGHAGRWLYVSIAKNLPAKGGYVLADDVKDTVEIPAYGKEVKLLSDGALLALHGEKKVSVYSLGASKMRFEVRRIMTRDIAHFVSQTHGRFENPSFEYGNFSEDNVSEVFKQEADLPAADPRKPQFSVFDFKPYLAAAGEPKSGESPKGKGLFLFTAVALDKDKDGKERTVGQDQRFVLLSDLGIIVKTARDGTRDIFVQSVTEGAPVSNAEIEVLGLNGLPIAKAKTAADGHAVLPDLSGYDREKRPVAYIVRHEGDLSFMPYDRSDREVDYSKYDTDGINVSEEGLKAYLFSDRGIYRPGEDIHIGVIVKQGDWAQDLSGLPLQMEVSNPRGRIVRKSVLKMDRTGFVEYGFSTQDISPTGVYNIRLSINKGDASRQLGSTSVRVEEFLPDTMKISADFNRPMPKGWMTPEGLKAVVSLRHLYGAPAVGHRVKANINVAPGSFAFKDYADYSFFDARKSDKSFDHPLGDAKTDAEGSATFDLNLAQFGNTTYRLTFFSEGFAQDSGRGVRAAKTVLISPSPYVVGMKPSGNLEYVNKAESRSVHFIALDPELRHVAVQKLESRLIKITYVSSLVKDERGGYTYRSVPKETEIGKTSIDIPENGLSYKLDTAAPGSYQIVLADSSGMILSRVPYTVVGEGNMLGHARKDAVLTVRLDKAAYASGDKIAMNVVAPYAGAGLITIETDRVIAYKWFRAATPSSMQSIELPGNFSGKGFVNIAYVRSIDSREVYTQPFAYAVTPFYASTSAIDSGIQLIVPEKIKPGETLSIHYKIKNPGKIAIFAVDEGILQYGRYKTPDPLGYFVNQRALQVGTAQILDLLMPEYSLLRDMAASGGDGALNDGKNLNPFKRKTLPPAVYWSGIIDAGPEEKSLDYQVPEYFNGSLRVMAVAVSDRDMAAAETKSFVRGDIIISPNAPLFAAPGDEFTVGLSIANNIPGSGKEAKMNLSASASEHLEILDGKESIVVVPEGSEAAAHIRVRAKTILGGASLTFIASLGDKSAHSETTLSVRPPLPSMTALHTGYIPGGEKVVRQDRNLYKEFAKADATLSTSPLSLVPGMADYLEKDPCGCTLALIGRAMPAVLLYGMPELGGDAKIAEISVANAMDRLRETQNQDGGFGFWGYYFESASDPFISAYAFHYMLLAREKHLPVPDDLFEQARQYLRRMVERAPSSMSEARTQAYGVYLLTRNGDVTAGALPKLLDYLNDDQKSSWKHDLAAVYVAAAYKKMQLKDEAQALMDQFDLGEPVYWKSSPGYIADDDGFYNSLNRYAQYLSISATDFPERLVKLDRNILFRIANFIGEGSYNVLSSSYAIMAFADYAQASEKAINAQLVIAEDDGSGKYAPLSLTGDLVRRAALAAASGNVKFGGGGPYGLFYQIATDGYDRDTAARPIEDGLEIEKKILGADGRPAKELPVGSTAEVVITMRAHGEKILDNIALVDLLPAGFELAPDKAASATDAANDNADSDQDSGSSGDNKKGDAPAADPWSPIAIDRREDRVNAYGNVPPEPVVFSYKIKAVNAGSFAVPPAYAESMRERSVKARGVTAAISVK